MQPCHSRSVARAQPARRLAGGGATIDIQVTGVPNEIFLTVDGQEAVELHLGDHVHCHRSEFSVRLLRIRPNGLFNVLRSKLKWGER